MTGILLSDLWKALPAPSVALPAPSQAPSEQTVCWCDDCQILAAMGIVPWCKTREEQDRVMWAKRLEDNQREWEIRVLGGNR
jgi:hypothetical protein